MSRHGGVSVYDGIPPLATQAEDFITRAFYGKTTAEARRRAYAMGLQCPLWLWTHQQISKDAGAPKVMHQVVHLVHWMHRHGAEMAQIAILVPLAWKGMFKHEFDVRGAEVYVRESPVILAHHELTALNKRDHTTYHYRAVLYLVGALPRHLNASAQPMPASEELFISEAMGAATDAFVLCADAGWMAPQLQSKWYKMFFTKLQGEQPFISFDESVTTEAAMQTAEARFPSLVGPGIPLCCSRHPNQRQIEHGHARIEPCCKHLCLSTYPCHREDHICTSTCHPGETHTACTYACGKTLPCGHKCLLKCGQPCNCFEVVELPLKCSHEKVIGMNRETLEPIYAVVHHVFKGVCGDAELPCAVEYESECARCLGPLTVKCFEAQEQGHTLEHKTMVCGACRRRERELRAKLMGELLTGAEAQKKKMKVELQRSLHHQRKAAAQGMFRPGTRVEIVDATKCVPPLFAEDDFPGIEFVDMASPNFFQEMDGAYGTFVSNHVDVMDRSEVRNLVRLPTGKHVLVTDGGLRMIQALTSNIASAAPLLLTFQGQDSSGKQGGAKAASVDGVEFAEAKTMLHGTFYLAQPVPCDACEGEVCEAATVTDKVVRVVGLDPLSPSSVVIEFTLTTVTERNTSELNGNSDGTTEGNGVVAAEHTPKRRRLEAGEGEGEKHDCHSKVIRLSVPIAALEPMPAMVVGKYIYVTAPERQVRDPRDLVKVEAQLRHLAGVEVPPGAHVTAAPIDADTPYSLVTIVNPPVNCTTVRGPCAVLRCSDTRVVVQARSSNASRYRRGGGVSRGNVSRSAASGHHTYHSCARAPPSSGAAGQALLVVVPFMFTVGDELAEAEGALDAAAQKIFEQRLHTELTAMSEDLALRNEEEAFHAQQQMPPVTADMMAAEHHAHSVPVPLPTPSAVAAARKSAMELPAGTSIATRLAHAKDKLAYKQEQVQLPQWMALVKERAQKDKESDAHHVKYIRSVKY
jgi:hypothetical protein